MRRRYGRAVKVGRQAGRQAMRQAKSSRALAAQQYLHDGSEATRAHTRYLAKAAAPEHLIIFYVNSADMSFGAVLSST